MLQESLNTLFHNSHNLIQSLSKSPFSTTTQEYQIQLQKLLNILVLIQQRVQREHLISKNEEIEDINTETLKYLLIDAFYAEHVVNLTDKDRKHLLEDALAHSKRFLEVCVCIKLLKDEEYDDLSNDSKLTSPEKQRESKIAKYKQEKHLASLLEGLKERLDMEDEEIQREYFIMLIKLYTMKIFELIKIIEQELQLIKSFQENQHEMEPKVRSEPSQFSKPFVLLSKREKMRNQVFQPGYNLPTMTIDEYLEIERSRGNIITGGGQTPQKAENIIDDIDVEDSQIYKIRQMDDFKDANPRGWGNTYNRS
ncbi:TAP42-like protein [Rozella allomycis CSF55]|uniref:TAP42-like protein n=1 Tax=Rozella allomycis (strain CSF55) TaxID=988480 RepID=A0A075B4S8_ROZAC|nr:TAP42-like protein domain-containing protein [Rozella allomycis CSF55]RKP22091.1 TAP42-like protein [Rozella allomycis CSF55]|eukprot:EPZ36459.1 TAP42-like protein domain-containing protein [Rozella allomycis CSF55]